MLIDLSIDSSRFVNRPRSTVFLAFLVYHRHAAISILLSAAMQITFATGRFGKQSRTLRTIVNRWIVRRNIMKESHADTTVVSPIYVPIEHRLARRFWRFGKGIDEASSCRLDNSINSTFVQGPFIYVESH